MITILGDWQKDREGPRLRNHKGAWHGQRNMVSSITASQRLQGLCLALTQIVSMIAIAFSLGTRTSSIRPCAHGLDY